MDKELKNLYEAIKLHYGAMTKVAIKAECSAEWVRQVLIGKAKSEKVLSAAIEVLKQENEISTKNAAIDKEWSKRIQEALV